jgi:hypothetical protein
MKSCRPPRTEGTKTHLKLERRPIRYLSLEPTASYAAVSLLQLPTGAKIQFYLLCKEILYVDLTTFMNAFDCSKHHSLRL